MSIYDKNHYNIVISLQLIKINEKKKLRKKALLVSLNGSAFQPGYLEGNT